MNRKFGFTLIELLVTAGLAIFLTSLGYASFRDSNNKQTVRQAAYTLKNNLVKTRTNATSGKKINCTLLTGYKMVIKNTQYEIQEVCEFGSPGEAEIILFPTNISKILPVTDTTVTFNTLDGSATTTSTIQIQSIIDTSLIYEISIQSNGLITDNGFILE